MEQQVFNAVPPPKTDEEEADFSVNPLAGLLGPVQMLLYAAAAASARVSPLSRFSLSGFSLPRAPLPTR